MLRRLLTLVLTAVVCAWTTAAFADAISIAKTVSESFARAASAGDIAAASALYADDATVIWPGAGEEAKGKPGIERLLRDMFSRPSHFVLKSLDATSLGENYVVDVGHWEVTPSTGSHQKPQQVRTSEVLARGTDGVWRYLIDHASIGMPAPVRTPTRTRKRARPGAHG